jgi:hypothetical protein
MYYLSVFMFFLLISVFHPGEFAVSTNAAAFSLPVPLLLRCNARQLPPPAACAKHSLFTSGVIQCQFRTAQTFGQNSSCRRMG